LTNYLFEQDLELCLFLYNFLEGYGPVGFEYSFYWFVWGSGSYCFFYNKDDQRILVPRRSENALEAIPYSSFYSKNEVAYYYYHCDYIFALFAS